LLTDALLLSVSTAEQEGNIWAMMQLVLMILHRFKLYYHWQHNQYLVPPSPSRTYCLMPLAA
jgi:hypothetical protein